MDHILKSRPVVATVAAIAASTVVLATTVAPPRPMTEVAGPRITTQVVALAALPEALTPTPRTVARASANQIDLGQTVQNALGPVVGGAVLGIFGGFIIIGQMAAGVIYRIPGADTKLAPLISAIAAVGAIVVGIPVGAVIGVAFGVASAVAGWASRLRPPAPPVSSVSTVSAKITTPQRSSKSGTRSDRHTVKAAVPAKTSAPQQGSSKPRAGTGRGHAAVSNRTARH
ncbi:hypothetical protein H7J51_21165 [Mycobacterium crocinum]|uniref:DUF456 domain-containing protein n=2 Tax=Mycolicibacterium TaxID=1866885 RepID=A0ABY3TK71_9MYCO|nr:hypothetical protein [Mycolicibacterium crocinum]MCV7217789.1 hypothetical protein [Mycolicibacterium crocinum]ULN41365.1 hypothetical protein MI149_27935 [Mycolicibacterium crocinum]